MELGECWRVIIKIVLADSIMSSFAKYFNLSKISISIFVNNNNKEYWE